MYNVNIIGAGEITVPKATTLQELSERYAHVCKSDILVAKVNNELKELSKKIKENSVIEFLDVTDQNGYRVYQRSVVFMMICAFKDILGKDTRVVVEHSINKNFFCQLIDRKTGRIDLSLTAELLQKIENKMASYVRNELDIEKISIPVDEGIKLANENGLPDKAKFLKYRRTSSVNFYKLCGHYNYFYGQMASNTKKLGVFKLVLDENGFILQFSSRSEIGGLSEIKILKKISHIFSESNKWAKILNADTVGALNDIICNGKQGDFIRANEALHEKSISHIADMINQKGVRIVLIAGPSSSGKTTFAERLSIQLRVNGLKPSVISLDNYYLDRGNTPLDENGQPDFEDLYALDVSQIDSDITRLSAGEPVDTPIFSFNTGRREAKTRTIHLTGNDVLIVEGIHGLNEAISRSVPGEQKFKIFISALTQLNIDDHNRIATSDTRLIRRIVRDHKFRGFNALGTLAMWSSVSKGESKHIFPYQEEADAIFNSALVYEMCVLKQYAEPLLFNIDKTLPEYVEARRLVKFLDSFIGIPAEEVPNNSILREFIGGGCFKT